MVEDRFEQIKEILRDLYEKHEDIEACMVVKKGLDGVVMFPDEFIEKISAVWEPLRGTIDNLLEIISEYAIYGIDKTYVEMLGYGIVFCVISMSDTSLVVFIGKKEGVETINSVSSKLSDILNARNHVLRIVGG
jgi:hypothetical protein